MYFKQIYTPGLAQCSYVVGGKNACVVVDPIRDVQQYIDVAASLGLPVKGIIETHLHADFVSGHLELSKRTGATVYITEKANAEFKCCALEDEEEFTVDTLLFKMIDTPGHTPDSAVFLVSDLERGKEPVIAFTGDTLMVGDAGRPDLFPEIREELASKLYDSLRKLEKLPDNIEIYPAHGAGSLCGRAISSKLSSTMGTEKIQNYAIRIHPREIFVKEFLEGMPEAPDHFSRCSEINRKGAPTVSALIKPAAYSPKKFLDLSKNGYTVLDTREPLYFTAAHIPGAYSIGIKGNFITFAGWLLPPDKPLLLVLEIPEDLPYVLKALYDIGFDNVAGYLSGGMKSYSYSGLETERIESISASNAKERFEKSEIYIIDVRTKEEWDGGHIDGAVNIPMPDIRKRYTEIPTDKPAAIICASGFRSVTASSLMKKFSGRKDIINIMGGMTAWINQGYPMVK